MSVPPYTGFFAGAVVSGTVVSPATVVSPPDDVATVVLLPLVPPSSFLLVQPTAIKPKLISAAAKNLPAEPDGRLVRTYFPL